MGELADRYGSDLDARFVRARHPYAYRSGEWAQIVGTIERDGERLWLVIWPDGATDEWVVNDDVADYELSRDG